MEDYPKKLMAFDQAQELVLSFAQRAITMNVELLNSLNRVLAGDAVADRDMPPFNKSAMDGYACRAEDLGNDLTIIDEIPAGSVPHQEIGKNQCARIMTGAMVPEGADFVLMKEHAVTSGVDTISCTKRSDHSNICYRAEDCAKGDLILKSGTLIHPSRIAILATLGVASVPVFSQPAVAVLSTGNELVEPHETPHPQQIRNSNGFQLMAQLSKMGIAANYLGITRDNEQEVFDSLSGALKEHDVILVSGGVSVGDYDFVPKALERMGAKIHLHGMNVKPGKHLLFATLDDKIIFGLPGNPVSSFVQFEILVKPFLLKKMGYSGEAVCFNLPLAADYHRPKADNLLFVPAKFGPEGAVRPLEYHGSAHINAYAQADGILEIPVGQNDIKTGETVHVRPL